MSEDRSNLNTTELIRRSRMLHNVITALAGTLDTVDLLYQSDEDLTPSQAVSQYLWTRVLPDVEPGALAPGVGFEVVLSVGTLAGVSHSWFTLRPTEPGWIDSYYVIVDPYFPGSYPMIVSLDIESPIIRQYLEDHYFLPGEGPQ